MPPKYIQKYILKSIDESKNIFSNIIFLNIIQIYIPKLFSNIEIYYILEYVF